MDYLWLIKGIDKLGKQPKILLLIQVYILVGLIGILDYFTGYDIGFAVFYFLPLSIIALTIGGIHTIIIVILCTISWITADIFSGQPYTNIIIPYWNTLTRLVIFLSLSIVLTYLKKALLQEKISARNDYLTGLLNLQGFYERANLELQKSRRTKRPLTVAYIDCDNFKILNDKFGHETGNSFLRKAATIMQNCIRQTDILARFGGDEFIILLPESTNEQAKVFIDRMQILLNASMPESDLKMTFSIGLATYHTAPDSVDEIINKADMLMFSAKKDGKNMIKQESFDD